MRRSPTHAVSLRPWLWTLLIGIAAAWGQAPVPDPGAPEETATWPADPRLAPAAAGEAETSAREAPAGEAPAAETAVAEAAAESPAVTCYRAAATRKGDAYVCDLAVQMARDAGSSRALAAALTNRALVLAREGRLEPALDDLDAAVAATPGDPAVHGNRANLLQRLGRFADALAAHERAISLAPRDPRGYYNRAFTYRALGELGQAEQDVATAAELLEARRAVTAAETPAPGGPRVR